MHQRRNNAFEALAENWNPRDSGKTTENPQLCIAVPRQNLFRGLRMGEKGNVFIRFSVNGTKSYHSFSLRLQFPVFAVVQTLSFAFYRKGQNLYEPCASARTFSNIDFQSNFSIRVNLFSNKLDLSESATHDPMYSIAYTTRHLNLWYGHDDSRNLMLGSTFEMGFCRLSVITWPCRMRRDFNWIRMIVYIFNNNAIKLRCQLPQNVVISSWFQRLALFSKLVQLIS